MMTMPVEVTTELVPSYDGNSSLVINAVDPYAHASLMLMAKLLNMTCEDRRFVLRQPSKDNTSSLRELIEELMPGSTALNCEAEIGSTSNNSLINYINGSQSSNAGDTAEDQTDSWIAVRLNRALLLYIPMIIYVVGLVGNTLSFSVLTSRRMYNVSSYTYLAVLAVADSLVLTIGLLPVWIEQITGSHIIDLSAWLCRFISVIGATVSDYSVWLIVAVTVERYIVVCHPLRAASLCQRRTALRVAAVIFVLALTINLNLSWTMNLRTPDGGFASNNAQVSADEAANLSGSDNPSSMFSLNPPNCDASEGYEYYILHVWPWIDACVYSLIPFITLVVLNVLITRQVINARRHNIITAVTSAVSRSTCPAAVDFHRHTSSRHGSAAVSQQNVFGSARSFNASRRCIGTSSAGASTTGGCLTQSNAIHIGVMLSTVTVAFLVTTLPMVVLHIVKIFIYRVSPTSSTLLSIIPPDRPVAMRLQLVGTICEMLMYTNHSINFFLYCAAGAKFRCELLALGRRVRRIFQPASLQRGINNFNTSAVVFNQSNVVMMTYRVIDRDLDTNLS